MIKKITQNINSSAEVHLEIKRIWFRILKNKVFFSPWSLVSRGLT